MALLQVRHGVGTFYTLRVVFLSAIIIICTEPLSVNAFLSSGQEKKGPDPRIKLAIQPKEHVIIPSRSFVLLHCVANFTDYPDYDYENDDMNVVFPSDGDFMQNDEATSDVSDSIESIVTNVCQQEVQYQWLRNGQPINGTNPTFIETFCNGTIKITHSLMATAIYRCVASTTKSDIGAVVSRASNVRAAVLDRKSDKMTSKAELSSSVVLNCPIESIPKANFQWTFNNATNINFDTSERYFLLNNGSLLIVNVKNEDYQSFRCLAMNEYFLDAKQIQHSLEVTNLITTKMARLLPALQNQVIFVANGDALNLYCAPTSTSTSKGNTIRWYFTPHTESTSFTPIELPAQNPNKLHIANTSVERNDGIYKCQFGDEYQTFDVTITIPPVIHNEFSSKEEALAFYLTLNCNVTGNPKPSVQWYHDGKLIKYDWIVKYKEPKLSIQTFEERDKGIYQCVATNMAGEAQATGLISLKPKYHADAPKNPKCFPINSTSIKVLFDGPQNYRFSAITYYMASKHTPEWSTVMVHDQSWRIQNEFTISDTRQPPFTPFVIYFRGMEKTSSDTIMKGGVKSWQFDLSRLSEGIKCATQGLPVYGMFPSNGIFIWWPKVYNGNVTSFVIQFQSDDITSFSDHIIGTTRTIDEFQNWDDISSGLTNIPATTNIHSYTDDRIHDELTQSTPTKKKTSPKMITELRVNGNVSGILIPNTHEIVVRVLVPIIDDEGELNQDVTHVEWKKIEDNSGPMAKFKVYSVGIHHVTFLTTDPHLNCVRICYRANGENICDDRSVESYVDVESLAAFTTYKFILFECGGSKTKINHFDVQTKHDIPGSVTNHKVYTKNGIIVEWSAPTKANGILKYYLIQWTIGNQTHSEKINYQSETDRNVFKFPGLQESDRFNITIRAVSNYGVGIPIYVDLRDVKEIPNEDYAASMQRDPRLGISIGVLLSLLCVIICVLIIVRHRRCSKSPHQQHINGNGNNAQRSFQNRSPMNRTPVTGTTTILPTTSAQIPNNCAMDAHEMQTLIVTSSIENLSMTNGNGMSNKLDNHMNGVVARGNRSSFINTNAHLEDDGNADLSEYGLISSTPKSKHKSILINNDHLKITSTNLESNTANPVDLAYRRIDCDFEALGANNGILCNGTLQQMKTTLPPNKSVHSILFNETEIPPTIKQTIDEKAKLAKRTSSNKSNISIPSIFDDSQQSLLPDANATESSSASTSSGSVPMDRINKSNYSYDRNTFDNGGPHAIVENQRYMRSAALV